PEGREGRLDPMGGLAVIKRLWKRYIEGFTEENVAWLKGYVFGLTVATFLVLLVLLSRLEGRRRATRWRTQAARRPSVCARSRTTGTRWRPCSRPLPRSRSAPTRTTFSITRRASSTPRRYAMSFGPRRGPSGLSDSGDKPDLAEVLAHYGVEVNPSRQRQSVRCPLQEQDRTSSMSVNLADGLWNCHSCGEGGDVWNLIMIK